MVPATDRTNVSLPAGVPRCVCRPSVTGGDPGVGVLHLEQAAVPATVRVVRTAVRDWATGAGLGADLVDAVVLAVDEAVTNVVDHAHQMDPGAGEGAGRIVLGAASRACGGGVAVSVDDDGTWRPPPPDPGHRGRGVQLIGRLSDRSTVTTSEHGTTVRMCWARPR